MKKRTEITIETERVVVVTGAAGGRAAVEGWCDECGAKSLLVEPNSAAAMLGVRPEAVLRWAECAGLHFAGGTAAGRALLCLCSLARLDNTKIYEES